jgi:putative ABC transport system substrate-binding protein
VKQFWILDFGFSIRRSERNKIFFAAVGTLLFVLSFPAEAQQPKKVPRIGYMHSGSKLDATDEAFQQGLRDAGYLERNNIVIEYRYAEGKPDRFPDLAAELVRDEVDIIVAVSEAAVRAAKNATKTIPIVMLNVGADPVAGGLVESLSRPGGNITGLTVVAVEIAGKRLELFKETVPKLVRVASLYDPAVPSNVAGVKEIQTAARAMGLTVQPWEIRDADGFERIFAALSKQRPDGLYVPGSPLLNASQKRIAGFALKSRLPSTYVRREGVDAGGLMSYGVDPVDHYRRAAYFLDRILKGTKPGDLPVERPKKFELVINLKTAKQIGLTIPESVLFRADKVIK